MAYPIKYIENNLVFNHDGECFAYYELLPYNYSFLNPEQKYQVHDSFRQLIAQNRDGKIHALQISTESSIRAAQERSKQEVTGKLKNVACAKIDAQTEALISIDVYKRQYQKCNAAYRYGGPVLAINMLNMNLDLDIQDYVTVDFGAIARCV